MRTFCAVVLVVAVSVAVRAEEKVEYSSGDAGYSHTPTATESYITTGTYYTPIEMPLSVRVAELQVVMRLVKDSQEFTTEEKAMLRAELLKAIVRVIRAVTPERSPQK